MDRRKWLQVVFGATVAAAIAPLVDLTDETIGFWNQPVIKDHLNRRWRVTFPDGESFTFNADVVSERMRDDGQVDLVLAPTGPVASGTIHLSFQPVAG